MNNLENEAVCKLQAVESSFKNKIRVEFLE
jgi:hypothetical protein